MMQSLVRGRVAALVAPAALVLALAACGGSSSGASAAAGTAVPTSSGSAGAGGGFRNGGEFQKIQECLTAAGISIPTPSNLPTARPTAMPSGGFGDGTRPSGAPGDGRGGFGGMNTVLQSASAKAALKACGLTVPTGRPSRPSAQPTSS